MSRPRRSVEWRWCSACDRPIRPGEDYRVERVPSSLLAGAVEPRFVHDVCPEVDP
jgi:hypothetical protein